MDWLTFIAEMTKALGWPLVAVAVLLLFRHQLRALLDRIKKGKFGPAEFEFEESIKTLKSEAEDLVQSPAEILSKEAVALLVSNPRAAIITSWLEVEESMRALLKAKGSATPSMASPGRIIQAIRSLSVVDPVFVHFTDELRQLRNQATHDQDFSPSQESVVDYVRLAKELSSVYRSAAEA